MLSLSSLSQEQLVGGLTDLATAASQKFTNPSSDLVVAADMASIAASLGVPGAGEAELGLFLISVLCTVLYPFWVPPWDPAYVSPNANQDPTGHPAR